MVGLTGSGLRRPKWLRFSWARTAQESLAGTYARQGFFQMQEGHAAEALDLYNSALAIYSAIMAKHAGYQPLDLVDLYGLIADWAIQTGDTKLALSNAEKELAIDRGLLELDAANVKAQSSERVADEQIGKAHELLAARTKQLGEWREARMWYQRSLRIWLREQKRTHADAHGGAQTG
jgi:tetratricopeptide (TPR) repeat protein